MIMIRFILIICLASTNLACHLAKTQSSGNLTNLPASSVVTSEPATETKADDPDKIVESFSDDSRIGSPHRNKIQIDILEGYGVDSANRPNNVAKIRFYSLNSLKKWILKQTLEIDDNALMTCSPEILDFNNDGFKDITFISNTAARGANEVRTLLIYDKKRDELVWIKNSEDYPNLAYNRTLNCVDSWMVHGASTTVFLHLEGDELKEFASVGTGGDSKGECCGLEVRIVDKSGEETVIKRKKITEDDIYTRYRTFNPPRP